MYIRESNFVREKVTTYNYPCNVQVHDSRDVANILNELVNVGKFDVEHFYVFTLNTKMKITGFSTISTGTLDSAPVHPRDVFKVALNTPNTAAIIVAHNHPSGDITPSKQDIEVTKKLTECGQIMGIPVIDSLIVNGTSYTSLNAYCS